MQNVLSECHSRYFKFQGRVDGIKVLTTRRLTRPPKNSPSGREMKASYETHESVPTPQLPEKKKEEREF